jgi:hypothetical protein
MRSRSRTFAVAVVAAISLGGAGTASASDIGGLGKPGTTIQVITHGAKKALPFAKAKRLQRRARRHGYPQGPKVKSTRGLTHIDPVLVDDRRRAATPGSEQLELKPGEPPPAPGKLFGNTGTYDGKKWGIVAWVNYVYSVVIPQLGGSFTQPLVYEVPESGTVGCGAITNNAVYCFGINRVGWSVDFGRGYFDQVGDGGFATLLAHEYGHGAQNWFGFSRGNFTYTLYREGFADCMAGGWMYWMYAHGYTDALGKGDISELIDTLVKISSPTTTLDNHGDYHWRLAAASYGWNYGMQGCRNWGRQLDAA